MIDFFFFVVFVLIGKVNCFFVVIKFVFDINIRSIVNIVGIIVFFFKELKFECVVWFVFFNYFFVFFLFIKNILLCYCCIGLYMYLFFIVCVLKYVYDIFFYS